jgi:hypothetical protein
MSMGAGEGTDDGSSLNLFGNDRKGVTESLNIGGWASSDSVGRIARMNIDDTENDTLTIRSITNTKIDSTLKVTDLAGSGDRYVYIDSNGLLKAGSSYP